MAEKKNEVATKGFKTALASIQETFTNMVVNSGQEMNIEYSHYQKTCVINALGKMQELAISNQLDLTKMDRNNITQILQNVAMLNLNVSSIPRECYIITRNVKVGDEWKKTFEFGIEGDGNDKLLRTFGVDVDKVHNCWLVRENDEFTYPSFNGLEITPPTWYPKDYTSKVLRVVYPIIKNDGQVEFHISERAEVVHNLQAHISNNLMKNKSVNDAQKDKLNTLAGTLTLDEIVVNAELLPYISPAWKNAGSKEAMIIRKMKNNATKKYPKDFKNAFTATAYEKTYDDYEQYNEDERINKEEAVETEVIEKAVSETVNVEVITSSKESDREELKQEQTNTREEDKNQAQPTTAPY